MITEDRTRDVAKAIEAAHYPTSKNVTGTAFMGEAKSFLAALNAAEGLSRSSAAPPSEFAFHDDALVGGASPADATPIPGVGHLVFEAQPKPGDGFSIGDSRYEFRNDRVDIDGLILIGRDLPSTVIATMAVINGTDGRDSSAPNLLVSATPGATPEEIVLTAREPGEPLVPIQTVAWSRVLTVRERALAERTKRDAEASKAASAKGAVAGENTQPVAPKAMAPA